MPSTSGFRRNYGGAATTAGVALSGAMIYSPLTSLKDDAVIYEGKSFDLCMGHTASNAYH